MASGNSSNSMDCESLISEVLNQTQSALQNNEEYIDSNTTCSLKLAELNGVEDVYLCIGWTKWACCGQILSNSRVVEGDDDPRIVLMWRSDEEDGKNEEMRCCEVVCSASGDRAVVVMGTDRSRILCVGVNVTPWSLSRGDVHDALEVMNEERIGEKQDVLKGNEGVRSLTAFYRPDECVYAAFGDGLTLQLPPRILFNDSSLASSHAALSAQVNLSDRNSMALAVPSAQPSLFTLADKKSSQEGAPNHIQEAICYGGDQPTVAFHSNAHPHSTPTTDQLKSDSQFYDDIKGILLGQFHKVLGSALGWSSSPSAPPPSSSSRSSTSPQTSKSSLPLHQTLIDPPRRILSASISPTSNLLTLSDALGRVLLLDLSTKQVIRMWKGLRDASCHWIRSDTSLFLLIHAKQRRKVEIYRMRHGPRVQFLQVGREVQIVQCTSKEGSHCFLYQTLPKPVLRRIELDASLLEQESGISAQPPHARSLQTPCPTPSADSALHLQLLQQLLTSDANVPSTPEAIYEAFTQISSLSHLSLALDKLAQADLNHLNIQDTTFHAKALQHCKSRLKNTNNAAFTSNADFQTLEQKVQFHSQLIVAYDTLRNFEMGTYDDSDSDSDLSAPRSPWAKEALIWIQTYETVTSQPLDDDANKDHLHPLPFAEFAKTCVSQQKSEIRLCDSTTKRKKVLVHIFRPLMQDIFVFKVVNTILEQMGIKNDVDTLQQYFGEWFMTLPTKTAAKASLFSTWCPILRWLQELITTSSSSSNTSQPNLQTLLQFCSSSSDLPRAFLLASVCHEAILIATKHKEAKTYGIISTSKAIQPWQTLLRKLRVCLLFTLRLHAPTPLGMLPVTVSNIENNQFSIYQWIARDELSISHNQNELSALESACRGSNKAFDPCSSSADHPSKLSILKNACLECPSNLGKRSTKTPLLLFFGHFNDSIRLASHRALLLGEKWGQQPQALEFLSEAFSALQYLINQPNGDLRLAMAIPLEIWQSRIRPVYRALLFGFHDVVELSEEIVGSLCRDVDWLDRLTQIVSSILSLIDQSLISKLITKHQQQHPPPHSSKWPPLKDDLILSIHLSKSTHQPIEPTSLDLHRTILRLLRYTDDVSSLHDVLVTDEVFLQTSLFLPPPSHTPQRQFLIRALDNKVMRFKKPFVDSFDEEECSLFSKTFQIPKSTIRSLFCLSFYKIGKDAKIDDLIHSSLQSLDLETFLLEGLEIACGRLHGTIQKLQKIKKYKSLLGMLDADTCQYVKEKGSQMEHGEVSLSVTHLFVLKLVNLSQGRGDVKDKVVKLSVLSGMLLKVLEEDGLR